MRAVPLGELLDIRVDRLSDGRRLSQRRGHLRLGEKLLLDVNACYATEGAGPEFQETTPVHSLPAPEDLPSEEEQARQEGIDDWQPFVVEWRWLEAPWKANASSSWSSWVRPRTPLGPEAARHWAALAYLGDINSDWSTSRRLGGELPRDRFISLDHVIWVHHRLRWDDWLLLQSCSDIAHQGRVYTRRELFDRGGSLVASMAQSALLL